MARFPWMLTLGALALAAGCSSLGAKDVVEEGCEAGFHACGTVCMPDESPLSCGSRCTPCPAPANGDATCTAAGCGVRCRAGHHDCGGACVDDASVTACGASCATCPAPAHAHAHAACLSGVCGYACDLGWFACASGCCGAPATGLPGLALGDLYSCGIGTGQVLECWGSNELGELGLGSMSPAYVTTPRPVAGAAAGEIDQVGLGMRHACAVDGSGDVRCWGGNGFGELGDGTFADTATPVTVGNLSGVVAAGGGWAHSCALLGNGTVRCWGNGEHGVLGDGHTYGGAVPGIQTVRGLTGAYALLCGHQFNCALTGIAAMVCWGDNVYRQLGTAQAVSLAAEPVDVDALTSVTALRAVALGLQHASVAYDGDGVTGGVRCWGRGDSGQLGNGQKPTAQASPVEVTGLTGVTALAAGLGHTCAVSGGAAVCWGANLDGQLGDGTWSERLTPANVSGLSSGVLGIAAGGRHTCAVVDLGGGATDLRCWGWNQDGQLGDGTRTSRNLPVAVSGF